MHPKITSNWHLRGSRNLLEKGTELGLFKSNMEGHQMGLIESEGELGFQVLKAEPTVWASTDQIHFLGHGWQPCFQTVLECRPFSTSAMQPWSSLTLAPCEFLPNLTLNFPNLTQHPAEDKAPNPNSFLERALADFNPTRKNDVFFFFPF